MISIRYLSVLGQCGGERASWPLTQIFPIPIEGNMRPPCYFPCVAPTITAWVSTYHSPPIRIRHEATILLGTASKPRHILRRVSLEVSLQIDDSKTMTLWILTAYIYDCTLQMTQTYRFFASRLHDSSREGFRIQY